MSQPWKRWLARDRSPCTPCIHRGKPPSIRRTRASRRTTPGLTNIVQARAVESSTLAGLGGGVSGAGGLGGSTSGAGSGPGPSATVEAQESDSIAAAARARRECCMGRLSHGRAFSANKGAMAWHTARVTSSTVAAPFNINTEGSWLAKER